MNSLLPKTCNRRKTRILILSAELFREPRAANWRLAVRIDGKRATILDTDTALEAAAREFATLTLRNLTHLRASSQQPALI